MRKVHRNSHDGSHGREADCLKTRQDGEGGMHLVKCKYTRAAL